MPPVFAESHSSSNAAANGTFMPSRTPVRYNVAWWLGGELQLLRLNLIAALGATALYALMGRSIGLTKERGHILPTASGSPIRVTVHPSYLLCIRDHDDRDSERRRFISDLKSFGGHLNA